jgi:hypothetical protein
VFPPEKPTNPLAGLVAKVVVSERLLPTFALAVPAQLLAGGGVSCYGTSQQRAMKRPADQPKRSDPPVESDPVWDLLAQSPPPKAGPMFARDVVRAARLDADAAPKGWLARAWAVLAGRPVLNFGAATAAVALAVFLTWPEGADPSGSDAVAQAPVAGDAVVSADSADPFADLEDVAAGELLADADLSKFSDDELIGLLGL